MNLVQTVLLLLYYCMSNLFDNTHFTQCDINGCVVNLTEDNTLEVMVTF